MKPFAAVLGALLALQPALGVAQDLEGATKPAEGAEALCLPVEAHQRILADLRELEALRVRTDLYNQAMALRDDQIVDLKISRDLAVQAQEELRSSLDSLARAKREAEESRDAWYRDPTVWFAAGVLGSLVIAIAADKIQE